MTNEFNNYLKQLDMHIMHKTFLAVLFGLSPAIALALSPWEYEQQEAMSYFNGANEIKTSGWGHLNDKVGRIATQLVEYSGQVFKIVPGQTFQWGQAHAGGWIILDISSASKPDPILAFRLAHEWGHQALGHQPNFYHPTGLQWTFRSSSTAVEDEADAYAGKFLAKYGYSLWDVAQELQNLPHFPSGDSHSDGLTRAAIVAKAYNSNRQGKDISDSECRIDSEGLDAKCNIANLTSDVDLVCQIQILGITRKGEALINEQTRTIPLGYFVVQHVRNFGDYDTDPIVKVSGFANGK
ncbi:MAG: hypothetical protein ACXV8I_08030 [Methylobacter sp.]